MTRSKHVSVCRQTGLILALTMLSLPAVARGQNQDLEVAGDGRLVPLRLVEHVGVLVDDLTPDAERLALTRETIQADAEQRLRLASLRVHDESGFPPVLYFQVSVICGKTGTCAMDVSSAVIQDVYLLQASSRAFRARTWSTGRILMAPRSMVARRVREVVREQADLFASDVLTARQRFAQTPPGRTKGPTN